MHNQGLYILIIGIVVVVILCSRKTTKQGFVPLGDQNSYNQCVAEEWGKCHLKCAPFGRCRCHIRAEEKCSRM